MYHSSSAVLVALLETHLTFGNSTFLELLLKLKFQETIWMWELKFDITKCLPNFPFLIVSLKTPDGNKRRAIPAPFVFFL